MEGRKMAEETLQIQEKGPDCRFQCRKRAESSRRLDGMKQNCVRIHDLLRGRPQGSQLRLGRVKKWWQTERLGQSTKLEADRMKMVKNGQKKGQMAKRSKKGSKVAKNGSKVI